MAASIKSCDMLLTKRNHDTLLREAEIKVRCMSLLHFGKEVAKILMPDRCIRMSICFAKRFAKNFANNSVGYAI